MIEGQQTWSYPVLAMDSSHHVASVALALDARTWLAKQSPAGAAQASSLLRMAEDLLSQAGRRLSDLGGLVLGQGPGSFTGLRIAAGLTQGLARSLNLKVVSISGFEALGHAHLLSRRAHPEPPSEDFIIRFDARLGEVYEGRLRAKPNSIAVLVESPHVGLASSTHPEGLPIMVEPRPTDFGSPRSDCPEACSLAGWSLAAVLAGDAQAGAAFSAQPLYVRQKVAQTIEERRRVKALSLLTLEPQDLASVMVIERQAYPFPWSSGNFKDSFASGYHLHKLVDQGAMVGYLVWMRVMEEAHLLNFTIAPARQRRGLGQWMFDALCQHLQSLGIRRLLLEVRPTNHAAIRLYKKNAMTEIGRRKDYYPSVNQTREDAVVLSLTLADAGS